METTISLGQGIGGIGPMLGVGDATLMASASASSASPSSSSSPAAPAGTTVHDPIPIILTHEGVSSEWKIRAARGPASRDVNQRNRIAEHVERTLGTKIELFISERQPCHGLTIDVLVVPPTEDRPFYVLVTRGLSEMHMNVHPLAKHTPSRIELVICLPKTWEVSLEAFRKSEQFFWPVRQLKRHALFPAIHNTFISLGHTIANELVNDDIPPSPDNPSRPFCSNTNANSMLMMVPALLPEEFHILKSKKSNKKKKKRTRKRETNNQPDGETEAKERNEGQDENTEAKNVEKPVQGEGEGNSTNEADNTSLHREQTTDVKPPGEESSSEEKQAEHEQSNQPEEKPQAEEGKEMPQEGERKKGRRRRGGKRKNKNKNGTEENSTTERTDGPAAGDSEQPNEHDNAERKSEAPSADGEAQANGTDNDKGKDKEAGGVPKQASQQKKPRKKKNEKLFVYGENKEDIYFYQLLPLYQEEVDFKLKYGLDALLERLEQLPPLEVLTVTPGRRNVCQTPVKRKILRAKRRAGKTSDAPQEKTSAPESSEASPRQAPHHGEGGQNNSMPPDQQLQPEPTAPHNQGSEQKTQPQQEAVEKSPTPTTENVTAAAKSREDAGHQLGPNGKGNEHK